jgi:hypothetical protein
MVNRGAKIPHRPILLHNSYSSLFSTAPASTVIRFREPRGLPVARDVEGNCLDPKVEERIRALPRHLIDYIRKSVCPLEFLERVVREHEPAG